MEIRNFTFKDWPQVQAIYENGIATGHATFETQSPDCESWDKSRLPFCRFVVYEDEQVLAWAALSPVSSRAVYSGVAEVSIYVSAQSRGKGIGKMLLRHLIAESENNGIWTLQAGIFPENKASVKLHEGAGFRIIGYREKIGKMHGLWRDTVQLERRSKSSWCWLIVMHQLEQDFKTFLRQFTAISEEEFATSITYFTPRILQKGEFFVKRDSICREVAYIHTGILRTFYHTDNGEDVTSCICTENCFTTTYHSVISHTPSQISIQALELSQLLVLNNRLC